MKKKKFLSLIIVMLMIFSPIFFFSTKTYAADDEVHDDEEVYTVILKSGNGTGDDLIIKSTDTGTMAEGETDARHGQFFTENNATYYCTLLSAPKSFSPPSDKQYSFSGWVDQNGNYLQDEDVKMNDYENNTLVLTAVWNDSFFEIETTGAIDISGPGYTDFTYTLKDLHLGTTDLGDGNKLIVDSVELEFTSGMLKGNGKTLPYLVCPTYGNPGKKAISESFTEADIGKQFKMSVYISPEDYNNVQAGTYIGELKCIGIYTCHPYSSANPDASSPNYIFETKKFRGNSILTLPLELVVNSENTEPTFSEDDLTTEEINSPKTGDYINIASLVGLVAISVLGFAISMIAINKKGSSWHKD